MSQKDRAKRQMVKVPRPKKAKAVLKDMLMPFKMLWNCHKSKGAR